MHTLYPGQRVIIEDTAYGTRTEGTLHSDPRFTHVKTIRLDNGNLFRTEGYLSCANCEYCGYQETIANTKHAETKQSLFQRTRTLLKTLFTKN